MATNVIDAEVTELGMDDGPADLYVNANPPAKQHRGLELLESIQQPDLSMVQMGFVAAPAVLGLSMGKTPMQRALLAGLGAMAGALAYDACHAQGWIE